MRSTPDRFSADFSAKSAATIVAFLMLFAVTPAFAQLTVTQLPSKAGSMLLEFSYDWDESLRTFTDSSGVQKWDDASLEAMTGGYIDGYYQLELPAYALPSVRIVDREFDEIDVSVARESIPMAGNELDVQAVGLGLYRKQPVVSIVAAAHRLDPNTSVLRRYRRLVVAVELAESPLVGSQAAAPFALSSMQRTGESVLSSGQIFRISITETGVYRINRSFLQGLRLNPDTIDPSSIQIFGNGPEPLKALAGAQRIDDLREQPLIREGAGDGNFGSSDFVLFYASAPSGWQYEGGEFSHFVHPFSNDNAVFMKIGTTGAVALEAPFERPALAPTFTTSLGRHFVDLEERVWSREHGSGHDWMSNTIRSGGERVIYSELILPSMITGVVELEARIAIASNPLATVAMMSDGVTLAQRTASGFIRPGSEFPSAAISTFTFLQPVTAGEPLNLTMRLLQQTNDPEAAVDWVTLTYEHELSATDGALAFTTRPGQSSAQQFQMSGFSSTPTVLDVTGGMSRKTYATESTGSDFTIFIPASDVADRPRDVYAFTEDAIMTLSADQSKPVENQNLHGIASFPEFVIVVHEGFLNAAERLADHRRAEGMDVEVVTQTQVFNEFSGGVADMRAVRDYMKFLYDRASNPSQIPEYLLLFGDGHYDYRGLSGFPNQLQNLVIPFETEESTRTEASYTSDDYFGLLDDDEGLWTYVGITAESMERVDIGIGRIPAQTVSEADLVVNKIIRYDNPETFGSWRTNYTAVADDGPTGLSGIQDDKDLHLANIDQVAELLTDEVYPQINMQKIYGETFDRVFLNGFKLPGAKKEIADALAQGTLVLNYSGHGGPDGLAQERIFTRDDAAQMTNGDKLPIFFTVTCSFGWWDLEDRQSGAEVLMMNDQGGAIALLTIVRLAYTSSSMVSLNAGLNRMMTDKLFRPDSDGLPKRLGQALLETKNTGVGLQGNSRKFSLLGDPSMRIGLPAGEAVVKKLKQVDLTTQTGQMKALDRVTIEGQVLTIAGALDTSFNGLVNVTVFDAERQVRIKEKVWGPKSFFRQREDLLWRGDVQAVAGNFTAEFVVPKDMSYSNERGRIAVYASNESGHAVGFSENFLVGGTTDNPPDDAVGPDLRLFINDTTFVDGGTVSANPVLIVKLFDESGINTVGAGVGHDMLLSIDEDDKNTQDIGGAFVAAPNSFQNGEIQWNLSGLEEGPHSVSVRAWDVLNNSGTADLSFTIANDEVLNVHNVYNYPNPMNRETRFVFEHNQPPGTPAEVQIRIYTLSGRPIRTIHSDEALPEGVLGSGPVQVFWDGKDDDLDRPATGVYLYRIRIAVEQAGGERQVSEHVEKLAIIR